MASKTSLKAVTRLTRDSLSG